jgi:aminomethyltransferase
VIAFAGKDWSIGYYQASHYKGMGILKENRHTRTSASLFDVSHLGVIKVSGDLSETFLEKVTLTDIKKLPPERTTVNLLLNKQDGIVDDFIITNLAITLPLHSTMPADIKLHKDWMFFLKAKLGEFTDKNDRLKFELSEENAILALQGSGSEEVLQSVLESTMNLRVMRFLDSNIRKIKQI